MALSLETPLTQITGIPPRFLPKLEKLGIKTVHDLLRHFPIRYEDFSTITPIGDIHPGEFVTVTGVIENIRSIHSFRKHIAIVEAIINDETGSIRATWFNQPYLKQVLAVGKHANFAGKVGMGSKGLHLAHPAFEVVNPNQPSTRHTGRLVPIYPETKGLTSKGLRFLIEPLLHHIEDIPEWIPQSVLQSIRLPDATQALRAIHFPAVIEDGHRAQRRFAFENVFLLHLANVIRKKSLLQERATPLPIAIETIKKILSHLPYQLTRAQRQALWEIIKDISHPHPAQRLLQGDVGSGKTIVAFLASLIASINEAQSALMVPTEVLAIQHYESAKKLFSLIPFADLGLKTPALGLITGHQNKLFYEDGLEASVSKIQLYKKIKDGAVDIVIGTHALIQKGLIFKNLGLVIIDEQHRFGVNQRAALAHFGNDSSKKNDRSRSPLKPHLINMSATPIPRTLMMTLFGDMDISLINEMPAGRQMITTRIVPPSEKDSVYAFIKEEVSKGRQAFIICPRVEVGEDVTGQQRIKIILEEDAKSVKKEYERLRTTVFSDLSVGMIHGKLRSKEKEDIMKKMSAGLIDVLVSTSVIEVGVDIPNATVMAIENSERFGLAQLYQFRGRIGRGQHASFCFLLTTGHEHTNNKRLQAIVAARNGFELAEMDLQQRGPGQFIGREQSGVPDIVMRSLQDGQLISLSKKAAQAIIEKDLSLKKYPLLKARLAAFQEELRRG